MNKIHSLSDSITLEDLSGKKQVEYLFIEADEDHIADSMARSPRIIRALFLSWFMYTKESLNPAVKEEKNSKIAFILPAFFLEKKEMHAFGLRFLTTLKRHMIKST